MTGSGAVGGVVSAGRGAVGAAVAAGAGVRGVIVAGGAVSRRGVTVVSRRRGRGLAGRSVGAGLPADRRERQNSLHQAR